MIGPVLLAQLLASSSPALPVVVRPTIVPIRQRHALAMRSVVVRRAAPAPSPETPVPPYLSHRPARTLNLREFRVRQARYESASPPAVCNATGTFCALPVLAQLGNMVFRAP